MKRRPNNTMDSLIVDRAFNIEFIATIYLDQQAKYINYKY